MFPAVIVLPVEIFENFLDKGFHSVQFIFSYIIFGLWRREEKLLRDLHHQHNYLIACLMVVYLNGYLIFFNL